MKTTKEIKEIAKSQAEIFNKEHREVAILMFINGYLKAYQDFKDDGHKEIVRRKFEQIKSGNLVNWTGMQLSEDEYNEGVAIYEALGDKGAQALNIFKMRKPPAKV